jgi:dihydroxy-acid dehydratase
MLPASRLLVNVNDTILFLTLKAFGEYIAGRIDEDTRKDIVSCSIPGTGIRPCGSCMPHSHSPFFLDHTPSIKPGAGACGGMYTANTMASAIETMGMSLPYSSSTPADSPEKVEVSTACLLVQPLFAHLPPFFCAKECMRAGEAMKHLLEHDIKPSDIMTRAAFENAMVVIMALGGSTNAVLHLLGTK